MNTLKMLACLLLSIFVLSGCISREPSDINDLLKPYQTALDELNEEIGASLYIPDEAKSTIYEAYKDYSIPEFKEFIRREYLNSDSDDNIFKEGTLFTEDAINK